MPAGTINKDLTPGQVFSTRAAAIYAYLGYYAGRTSGRRVYVYAGPLDTPSIKDSGTSTAPDSELMDFVHPAGNRGGVRYALSHGYIRATKSPVRFDSLEKTIEYKAIAPVLDKVFGYARIGDRK